MLKMGFGREANAICVFGAGLFIDRFSFFVIAWRHTAIRGIGQGT
jgi:hypothetical protein